MERVAVYIDGANFFYGLRSINPHYSDLKFDFDSWVKKIVGKHRKLVKVGYYNAPLKQQFDSDLASRQQRFFSRLDKLPLWEVKLSKRRKRISPDGNIQHIIKGDDIHLAVDMVTHACDNEFDVAILVSGDGDFLPLIKEVKKRGKKVETHHFDGNIALDLLKHSHVTSAVDKKTVNKHFYRREQCIEDTDAGKKIKKALASKKKKKKD